MKMMTLGLRAAMVIALAGSLGACASSMMSSNTVDRNDVGRIDRAVQGRIIDARQVTIGGTKSGTGAVVGAVVGGAAGSQIGGGNTEHIIAGVIGATAGALIGDAVEEGATKQPGIEYAIRLDSGETIYVIQPADYIIKNGSRVSVVYGAGGRARVVPIR
jgi:outer membrane lipoprotein SlyB